MTKKGHFSGKRRMPTLPTATKEQKVQKIRNAEYYDFQGVQDTLYTQSKENKVFRKLMTIILSAHPAGEIRKRKGLREHHLPCG